MTIIKFAKNVEIYIDPPIDLELAKEALNLLRVDTLKEKGALDFVILQDREDERHFFLWEVFKSLDDFIDHHKQEHTKQFLAKGLIRKIASYNLDIIE